MMFKELGARFISIEIYFQAAAFASLTIIIRMRVCLRFDFKWAAIGGANVQRHSLNHVSLFFRRGKIKKK